MFILQSPPQHIQCPGVRRPHFKFPRNPAHWLRASAAACRFPSPRDFRERPGVCCEGFEDSLAIDELPFAAAGNQPDSTQNLGMVRDGCRGDYRGRQTGTNLNRSGGWQDASRRPMSFAKASSRLTSPVVQVIAISQLGHWRLGLVVRNSGYFFLLTCLAIAEPICSVVAFPPISAVRTSDLARTSAMAFSIASAASEAPR